MEVKFFAFWLLTLCCLMEKPNSSFEHVHRKQSDSLNKAAVVTNSFECTNIGLNILKCGGSVADAAIAALFCEGVSNPQSMGLGGGFLLTIFKKSSGTVQVLNARENAPYKAHKDMFNECGSENEMSSGGLSVAVPGELKGYWELHKKYGKLPWSHLVKPTIKLLQRGIYVSNYLSKMIKALENEIVRSPSLKKIFLNRQTGKLYQEGDVMNRPRLAETLAKIAEKGPNVLYNGPLTDCFIQDIQDAGGVITKDDLKKYKPRWMKPLSTTIATDFTIYTVPSPGAGSFLLLITDLMSRMIINCSPVTFWHRLIEVWKFAYGLKTQQSGPNMAIRNLDEHCYNSTVTHFIRCRIKDSCTSNDPSNYFGVYEQPEDHGTAHISILAPNGDAISVTSTINLVFGAFFASPSTGIILNNQMMDFAIPNRHPWKANPSNYIKPQRQPVSTMCPTIILSSIDNSVRMIVGASGGFKILSATSLVVIRHLLLGECLEEAVAQPRLHHQLVPMEIEYEPGFPPAILKGLSRRGHVIKQYKTDVQCAEGSLNMPITSAVNAISVCNDNIEAIGDRRRHGYGEGF
ncbi:glutathione hydrolase 1 proenzyme-like isoform X2 [Onthophagus taurus]|uniref:glutathione hydrolase 1 proenzyme-like isoform X2 n=1 Tax=Onthophagus taurus TaxID=166361 RepID=UPI0039BE2E6F